MLLFAVIISIAASAQQGTVYVSNTTSCPAAITFFAKCPDCSEYSDYTSHPIPPNSGYQAIQKGSTTPWLTAPGCSNWRWQYAQIDYGCALVYVGNDDFGCGSTFVLGNPNGVTLPNPCPLDPNCAGSLVQASWTVSGSDIYVIIY